MTAPPVRRWVLHIETVSGVRMPAHVAQKPAEAFTDDDCDGYCDQRSGTETIPVVPAADYDALLEAWVRDRENCDLHTERDALAKRVEELEKQVEAMAGSHAERVAERDRALAVVEAARGLLNDLDPWDQTNHCMFCGARYRPKPPRHNDKCELILLRDALAAFDKEE